MTKETKNLLEELPEKHKKTRRGVVLYSENPYISGAAINTRPGARKVIQKTEAGEHMMIVNSGTGEIVSPSAGFWQSQQVDRTQFVKLYVNGVRAFKDLTGAGTKVFEVLFLEVQKTIGKDRIFLTFPSINQQESPMSQATFTRGMHELVTKSFIAPTTIQGWFFINPDYIWNGDRLAFVQEYRIKSARPKQPGIEELEAAGQQRLIE